jgi:hypothetical protein
MSTLQVVEKWYAENRQRLSAQSLQVNIGKTPDDSLEGWTWSTIESGSKTMQIIILNSGLIEAVVWDELASKETKLADRGIARGEELAALLSEQVRALGE